MGAPLRCADLSHFLELPRESPPPGTCGQGWVDVGKLFEGQGGGAREEWAAQAERWVARAKKTAVTIHLLGLVLCLSKLVAMLHIHLWSFKAHVSREGTQNRLLCCSAGLQGRGLHVSFLPGGCFFPLSSYLFLFKSRHVLHPCVHPCPPSLLYKPPLNLPAGCFVSVCAGLLLHLSVCAGLLLQAELLAGSHEAECTGQKLSEGFWVPRSLSGRPKALELDGGSL